MNSKTRTWFAVAWMLLFLSGTAVGVSALGTEDVIRLLKEGVSERVVLAQIEAEGARFRLDAEQILALHKVGASEELILRLIDTKPSQEVSQSTVSSSLVQAASLPAIDGEEVLLFPMADGQRGKLVLHLEDDSGAGFPATRIRDKEAKALILRLTSLSANGESQVQTLVEERADSGELILDHPERIHLLLPEGTHRVRLQLLGVTESGVDPQVLAEATSPQLSISQDAERDIVFKISYRRSWGRGEDWGIVTEDS